ncbi:MAG: EF-hand domain-containing protein [Chthoniobacter sp.]|uniref:EF-hand domain-containing protein n=1 Tax=Chthoniobacter sp. TaxID=2510640 RepID=UPI0032A54975
MNRLLLSAFCAVTTLSLFVPDAQAENPGTGTRRRATGTPEEHVRQIISKYDKDGDHALNATELAAFFEVIRQRVTEHRTEPAGNVTPGTGATGKSGRPALGSPQDHAAKAIEKFDKNGDGKLDAGELVALLTTIREKAGQHRSQKPGPAAPATPVSA